MTYQPEWWPLHFVTPTWGGNATAIVYLERGSNSNNRYYVTKYNEGSYFVVGTNQEDVQSAHISDVLELYCWLLARDPANPHREDVTDAQDPADP